MAETHVEDFVSDEDLKRFKTEYVYELQTGTLTEQSQFQYGWALIRSRYKDDIRNGIELLEGLCSSGRDQRDFLFFLAIGYYKIGEFNTALCYLKRLLSIEPNNYQAKDLESMIKNKMSKDGILGLGMLGGVAAFGLAAIVGLALVKKR